MEKTRRAALIAVAGLLFAPLFLTARSIKDFSPTYDEPVHLTAGYLYWKTGNIAYNGLHHPPLGEAWAAVPLIFMKPLVPMDHPAWQRGRWDPLDQYRFADRFLYHNRISADRLMEAGRRMQVVLSILLGALIAWAAWTLGGPAGGIAGAALWSFSPTFLAHGAIVSTDLMFTAAFFAFFFFLSRRRSWFQAVATGVALGACFASKYFSILIPLIVAAMAFWRRFVRNEKETGFGFLASAGIVAASAAATLALVYKGGGFEIFWTGLENIVGRSQAGRSSFFNGKHGVQGWLTYFPFVFAVKSTLPELAGLLLVVGLTAFRKIKIPEWLWIPPLFFFAVACVSKVQIGHRHLLAVYPFLFVAIGLAFSQVGRWRWAGGAVAVMMAVEAAWVIPNHLSYFNQLVGGSKNGYKYLTDSNVDWGQGLKLLGEWLPPEQKEKGIFLSYFGVADPHEYGIRYISVGSDTIAGHEDDRAAGSLRPSLFAISATNLQATYFADKQVFNWVKAFEPSAVIAHSLFVYDFSSQPAAMESLRRMTGVQ